VFTLTPEQGERFLARFLQTINNFLPDQPAENIQEPAADEEEPNNPADE